MKNHPLFTKDNILYLILALVLFIVGGYYTFPQFQKIFDSVNQINTINQQIIDLKAEIVRNNQTISNESEQLSHLPVKIYEPPYKGLALDSAMAGLLDNVVEMLKTTKAEVTQVAYNPSDKAYSGGTVPAGYEAVSITFTMNASYKDIRDFLVKVYSYPYLVGVKNVQIAKAQVGSNKLTAVVSLLLLMKAV
jgi:hypothetical protein